MMDPKSTKQIYIIRETANQRTYPIAWTFSKREAEDTISTRVEELVLEHENDAESKAFVHKGPNRTSIFKQCAGFFYNGNMVGQQTLSIVEVPHASSFPTSQEVVGLRQMNEEEILELTRETFID